MVVGVGKTKIIAKDGQNQLNWDELELEVVQVDELQFQERDQELVVEVGQETAYKFLGKENFFLFCDELKFKHQVGFVSIETSTGGALQ